MELQEKPELNSILPILPRLDKLEHAVQILENQKYSLSRKYFLNPELGNMVYQKDHWMTLSKALDEVNHKGTLMERLQMLEKRVFELSIDLVEEKYLGSSSSSLPVSEKSEVSSITKEDEDVTRVHAGNIKTLKIDEVNSVRADAVSGPTDNKKRGKQKKKWRSLLGVVCSHH